MSVFSLIQPTTWANNMAVITRATFNTTWQLFLISGSSIRWYGGSITARVNVSSSGFSTSGPTAIGVSDTGGTTSAVATTVYANGQAIGTGLGTAAAAPVSNTNNIILGTYNGTSGYPFAGSHLLDIVWNRTLSADEHATLAANPWQIFRRHIPIEWMTGQASTTSVFFRRTLYDRAGSRGVA